MPWSAAIIAGGPASRLGGRNKSSLPVGGRSILDRQIAALRPLTDRITIVANTPARFRTSGLPVVRDVLPGAAALGGIYTALACATTEYVLVIACDMPFLTGRFLEHLADRAQGADLAIPRPPDGYQPMCACYARTCREPIRTRIALGTLRIQDLVADVRTREIGPDELAAFDPDGRLFFNVNTPADYERAQQLAERYDVRPDAPDDRITQRGRPAANKPGAR
jgi:molybdopterin-guanine dinucleotide biosynthesis protein A